MIHSLRSIPKATLRGLQRLWSAIQPTAPDQQDASTGKKKERRAVTVVEYCFVLAVIFLVCLLAVRHLGESLRSSLETTGSKIEDAGV
jgi:Flp pilus assembly pilin Flp